MKVANSPIVRTLYYNWFGDACRIHHHANGSRTADLYRGLRGIMPISPLDLPSAAREITVTEYDRLVERETALHDHKCLKDYNRRIARRIPLAITQRNISGTLPGADPQIRLDKD